MRLTLHERYALSGLLPVQGNFLTMKRLRELREALGATEAEKKEFAIIEEDGRIGWDAAHNQTEREIEIGESMTDLTATTLKKLDDEGKLGVAHVSLFEKFVEKVQPSTAEKPDDSKAAAAATAG